MKHDWESRNPAENTEWFKYFGCHDLRECKNCGAVQAKEESFDWGRVTGHSWQPKAGSCIRGTG
jgi:hypothetical protein